jgi:hypothetical protein
MTITVDNLVAGPFVTTGVAQNLPFTFKAFTDAEVEVYRSLVDGAEVLVDPDAYSVALNENVDGSRAEGGAVTITWPAGASLYVRAAPSRGQAQTWTNQGARLSNLNEALDRLTLLFLRQGLDMDRAVAEAGGLIGLVGKVDKTALLSNVGDTLIGTSAGGDGAIPRLLVDVLRETQTVSGYEDVALAIDSFTNGGTLYVPRGGFAITVGLGIGNSISLVGQDATSYIDDSAIPVDQDTVTITPTPGLHYELQRIENLTLGDPATGARGGRHGILVDTTEAVGQFTAKLTIQGVNIGLGAGKSIYILHDPTKGVQGGSYATHISNCILRGSLTIENAGDSISILDCIIAQTGVSVNVNLTAGASLLAIERCNLTGAGGAIRSDYSPRIRVLGNNCEHSAVGAVAQNDSAVYNFAGTNGVTVGGIIAQNLISAFGASDAMKLLRIDNARGTLIQDNVFLAGLLTVTTDIEIGSSCQDVRIGGNTYNRSISGTRARTIVDNGQGTMGVEKTLTLLNGWAPSGASQPWKFIKSLDGMVTISGRIAGGTSADDTSVGTLPVGFRPAATIWVPLLSLEATGYEAAWAAFEATGGIKLYGADTATNLGISASFPAAFLADAFSPE